MNIKNIRYNKGMKISPPVFASTFSVTQRKWRGRGRIVSFGVLDYSGTPCLSLSLRYSSDFLHTMTGDVIHSFHREYTFVFIGN